MPAAQAVPPFYRLIVHEIEFEIDSNLLTRPVSHCAFLGAHFVIGSMLFMSQKLSALLTEH